MERLRKAGITAESRTRLLLTAAEAYPALEMAFLDAREEIRLAFRIFDLDTRLRSARARAVGDCWFDLIVHVLRRGVHIHIDLSDFDPCGCPTLHRRTWRTMRMLAAARELAGPRARLSSRALMHPAQAGLLPRVMFWPLAMRRLRRHADWLNDQKPEIRKDMLRDMPGLAPYLVSMLDGRVRCRIISLPHLRPVTHHQKLAIFDKKRLYIGGLDLDDRRFDTPEHRRAAEQTWHDVQVMATGPVVSEARKHLASYHETCAGLSESAPPRRLLRTLSRRRGFAAPFLSPQRYRNEIEAAHEMQIARARRLIYLETQFFRSTDLAHLLAQAARENPQLGLILMLPAAPEDLAFDGNRGPDVRFGEFLQARAIKIVKDAFGARAFIGCPAAPRSNQGETASGSGLDHVGGAPILYIHAKVSIFDDETAIVSSANLNGRSLRWDTESGMILRRGDDIARIRARIMQHWLPKDADECYFDPVRAVSAWAELARLNAQCAPAERNGFVMPYDPRRAARFGRWFPGLPEEMV